MIIYYNCAHKRRCSATASNADLFRMLCNYDIEQKGERLFFIHGPRDHARTTYLQRKNILHDLAIEWQANAGGMAYSYEELADWAGFFEEYGRKYGLLCEFRENGIL